MIQIFKLFDLSESTLVFNQALQGFFVIYSPYFHFKEKIDLVGLIPSSYDFSLTSCLLIVCSMSVLVSRVS
jgi:hypothetical protein